jgi:hypothetical protein
MENQIIKENRPEPHNLIFRNPLVINDFPHMFRKERIGTDPVFMDLDVLLLVFFALGLGCQERIGHNGGEKYRENDGDDLEQKFVRRKDRREERDHPDKKDDYSQVTKDSDDILIHGYI